MTEPFPRGVPDPCVLMQSELSCECALATIPYTGRRAAVLHLDGEIDLSNVSLVVAHLGQVFDLRPDVIVVDLAHLRFCSVGGYVQFTEANLHADRRGIGFAVSGLHGPLRHIASKVWCRGRPACHATVADAIDALEQTVTPPDGPEGDRVRPATGEVPDLGTQPGTRGD